MVVGTSGIYILLSAILGIVLALAFGLRYIIRIDQRTKDIVRAVMSKIKVTKIASGTVIDHIPAGKGLKVIEALGLRESDKIVTLGMNLESKKLGKKDLVKVESKQLTDDEIDKIKEISEKPTINIIEDWEVKKKRRLSE